MGCRLRGCTESDTTEAMQQQQQQRSKISSFQALLYVRKITACAARERCWATFLCAKVLPALKKEKNRYYFFLEQFEVQSKNEQEVQTIFMYPPASQHTAASTANILHQRRTCVTVYERTLAHHCHSNSIVYLGFTFVVVRPPDFWKMYNDRCHHCGIIQSSFTPLRLLCALSIHPCLPCFGRLPIFLKSP